LFKQVSEAGQIGPASRTTAASKEAVTLQAEELHFVQLLQP